MRVEWLVNFGVLSVWCLVLSCGSPTGHPGGRHDPPVESPRPLREFRELEDLPTRDRRSFARLRNHVDRLSLRQKIDQLLIRNLQKEVKRLQEDQPVPGEGSSPGASSSSKLGEEEHLTAQQKDKEELLTRQEEEGGLEARIKASLMEEVELLLHQELNGIRSEVSDLKKCCRRCGRSEGVPLTREETTVQWVLQILPDLQKNVKDLQESTDLMRDLHQKQFLDSRLEAVDHEVTGLQKSLTTLKTQTESQAAVVESLKAEVAEDASRIHLLERKVAEVEEATNKGRTALDDLFKALPDGIFSGDAQDGGQIPPVSSRSGGFKSSNSTSNEGPGTVENRMERLELKTSSLDFALMNLQKKVFYQTAQNVSRSLSSSQTQPEPAVAEEDPFLPPSKTKLRNIESTLSKLKNSSESVLNVLSRSEKRSIEAVSRVNQKLAQVEAQVEREKEERTSENGETDSKFLEAEKEIRTDYVELKNDITYLKNKLITIEDRVLNPNKKLVNENVRSVTEPFLIAREECLKLKVTSDCADSARRETAQFSERLFKLEDHYQSLEKLSTQNSNLFRKRRRHHHGNSN